MEFRGFYCVIPVLFGDFLIGVLVDVLILIDFFGMFHDHVGFEIELRGVELYIFSIEHGL